MDTLMQFIWAVTPSIFVSIVMSFWNKRQKDAERWKESKERDRVESDTLRLDLIVATAQLSYAVAMAQKRGTPNGEMESAMEKYDEAMAKFRRYERAQVAKSNIMERGY